MKKVLLLIAALLTLSTRAQLPVSEINPDKLFQTEGEVYFRLPGAADMAGILTRIISIDAVKDGDIYAYAGRKEFLRLQESGGSVTFELLPHPGDLINPEMTSLPMEVLEWNFYPTYTAYEELMEQFAADYPDICTLHTFGVLPSGRKLMAVRISDNVNADEDEPEFFYTSTMHGDETTGYVLMLHLIDYLLTNYNQDPRVTGLVNNIDIWINPLANPDGTYFGGNHTVNGARRYNANYVDINRNFPDPNDGPHPDGNAWQPETVAFMEFAESRNFVMSANFHGGAEVVNYPWDTWSRPTADENWWIMVSRQYADTVHANSPPGYFDDLENGISNGYDWYRITGGRQDYMNYFQQCREVTLEISNTKLPPASQLPLFWNYNYRSILNYLEQVTYGIRGIVSDTITGEPLKAQVLISGHDTDSSMVFSSLPAGNYHRLIKAGTYNLTFIADGYLPKTVRNVTTTDFGTVVRNVRLWDGSAIPAFSSSATTTHAGGTLQFFDNSGGNPTSRLWTFEGGNIVNSTVASPVVTYNQPGTYAVTLYVENAIGGNSLTIDDYITVEAVYYIGFPGDTSCNARFFDSQGPDGNYTNNENLNTTFFGGDPGKVLRIRFNAFDIEESIDCESDALLIYDGPTADSPLLAKLCGNTIPQEIFTSVNGGAVTFVFRSDASGNGAGWDAEIICDSGTNSLILDSDNDLLVYPNPATDKDFNIHLKSGILREIRLSDLTGRVVYRSNGSGMRAIVPVKELQTGIYLLQISASTGNFTEKVAITR